MALCAPARFTHEDKLPAVLLLQCRHNMRMCLVLDTLCHSAFSEEDDGTQAWQDFAGNYLHPAI